MGMVNVLLEEQVNRERGEQLYRKNESFGVEGKNHIDIHTPAHTHTQTDVHKHAQTCCL